MTPGERQALDIYDAQGECFACGALREIGGHGRVEYDGSDKPCPLAKLADERQALEAQIEELRQAKNIPPRDASCCHSFGEWCDACVGGVVRQWNADRKKLQALEGLIARWREHDKAAEWAAREAWIERTKRECADELAEAIGWRETPRREGEKP